MRRLPLRLLRSAASSPRRRPAPSHPPSPNPAAPPALLPRWGWGWAPPRRGYSRFATGFTPLQPKPLASILDVERASGLSPDHLVAAWDDVIPLGERSYRCIYECKALPSHGAKISYMPSFCYPFVERNWIYYHMPHMIFTGLEDYKARGTQASPYYTITHYTDFAETKDTVLIRGDVVFTSKLTDSEAKCLLETAHSFYLNDVRYRLVERFNKEPHEFEFKDVLQVLEMPTM
uniref:ATP synthase mitochondrial F1 complex assembly factor 1 n=1 Tax=Oryza meridionalis TaxID=40149 RepID=A0A0E0CJM1_9ORYZ